MSKSYPNVNHITAGRDGRGVETTLCGLVGDQWEFDHATYVANREAGRECKRCKELDG